MEPGTSSHCARTPAFSAEVTYVEEVLAVAAVALERTVAVDGLVEEMVGAKVIASHELLRT